MEDGFTLKKVQRDSFVPIFLRSVVNLSIKTRGGRRERLNSSGGMNGGIVNVSLWQQRWNYYKLMEKFKFLVVGTLFSLLLNE